MHLADTFVSHFTALAWSTYVQRNYESDRFQNKMFLCCKVSTEMRSHDSAIYGGNAKIVTKREKM
jgi:hypothetical protein